MAIVNVSKATDVVLDYLVAKCEAEAVGATLKLENFLHHHDLGFMEFSTDWAQGGPIIDREKIETVWVILDANGNGYWKSQNLFTDTYGYMGKTPLIAAMRCYVASKMGNKVEVPDELIS
jgi:hypothetical protein